MFFSFLRLGALAPKVGSSMRTAARSLTSSAAHLEETYAKPLQWVHWLTAAGTLTIIGTVKAAQWTTGPTYLGTKGQTKGTLMLWHKSTAVLMTALFVPRLLLRAAYKAPAALEGSAIEQVAAKVGHASLYGFMLFMPASGGRSDSTTLSFLCRTRCKLTLLTCRHCNGILRWQGRPVLRRLHVPRQGGQKQGGWQVCWHRTLRVCGKASRTPFAFCWGLVALASPVLTDRSRLQAFGWHKSVGQFYPYALGLHVGAVGYHVAKGQAILKRINPLA